MLPVRVITKGLAEIKLLKGSPQKLIKEQAYRKFYMHRTGHWLGLDVHDVGDYKVCDQWRFARTRHGVNHRAGHLYPRA